MSGTRSVITELLISAVSLILSALGVPSEVDIAIVILKTLQMAIPSPWIETYILAFRALGWFLTANAIYCIYRLWQKDCEK